MSSMITPAKKIAVVKPVSLAQIGGGLIDVAVVTDKKQEIGEVVSIGKGVRPVEFKVGDWVAYRVFGGTKFLIRGEEMIFVNFDDILARISK